MASFAIRYCGKNHLYRCHRYFSQSSPSSRSIILGIESSCDDTACAIVDSNGQVLGESISSQHEEMLKFGGILPLIAQHFHQQNIDTVVKNALKNAAMTIKDVDAVAVTTRPGLTLSLIVGLNYAKEISKHYEKSFIPIHHMEAHALVARLVYPQDLSFPYLTLLISGGHCLLAVVHSVRHFVLLGKSIEIAPGEVFDKLARRLKIFNVPEYRNLSGGAAVETAARLGNPFAITFTEPLLHYPDCNFSFAGLKSHMVHFIANQERKYDISGDEVLPNLPDICASVQFSIAQHICRRLQRGMEFLDRKKMLPENDRKLVVSGGVACNSYLLRAFRIVCQEMGYSLLAPPPKYCTDNGVMIAWNGVEKYRENVDILSPNQVDEIKVVADWPLGEDATAEVSREAVKCTWIKLKNLLHAEADDGKRELCVEKSE